jgi:hypothetical protein
VNTLVVPLAARRSPPPPAAPEIEVAVIGAVLEDRPEGREALKRLQPQHFFVDAHRHIYSAACEVALAGEPVELATVVARLRVSGRLDAAGGAAAISKYVEDVPANHKLGALVKRLRELSDRRRMIATLQQHTKEGYGDVSPSWLSDVQRDIAAIAETANDDSNGMVLVDVDRIFAPLPPIPYVCQHIDLCPGAPSLWAGYGYSGKTLAVQSLGLSVASGRAAWGAWHCARGPVVHVDYEQGLRLTSDRYQRLALGMGITADELRGQLRLASLPRVRLSDSDAEDVYTRACTGAKLLIVDSLRASGPSVDENSSEVRNLLDVLTRVSERTGCAAVVIHHARKPSNDSAGGAKASIRGSGAIFDACGSVLVFVGEKGKPTAVSHEKARTSGITADDFALGIVDVPSATGGQAGLVVTAEHLAPLKERREDARLEPLKARVLEFIIAHGPQSTREIRKNVTGNNTDKDRALLQLCEAGKLSMNKESGAHIYARGCK